MPRFHISLLRGSWAIRPDYAMDEAERILGNISQELEFVREPEATDSLPYSVNSQHVVAEGAFSGTSAAAIAANGGTREQTVNIIPIMGPMMKGDMACGPVGMRTISNRIAAAASDRDSVGTILLIDSPGGQTSTVPLLQDSIRRHREAGKRIIVVGEQVASAALMSALEAEEIWLTNTQAEIGSLGVLAGIIDDSEALAAAGIKQHIVYATPSSEKNAVVMEALKGNYDRLQQEVLDPIAYAAIDHLKGRRPKVTEERVFAGAMFYAEDALKIGLIDRIGTLNEAVDYLFAQARKTNSQTNHNTISKKGSKMKITSQHIPMLLAVLALTELNANDEGFFELSSEQVDRLAEEMATKYHRALPVRGIAEDGTLRANLAGLMVLEAAFGQAANTANMNAAKVAAQRIAALEGAAEPKPQVTRTGGEFVPDTDGWNAVTDAKPWNKLAFMKWQLKSGVGNVTRADVAGYEMTLNSAVVSDQMNEELGAYHRGQNMTIVDFLWEEDSADVLFPARSTGQLDEMPQVALFLDEFIQARNAQWAEKGGFEYQADKNKVKSYQMSYRFTEAELYGLMTSWIGEMVGMDHPFHESFVQYLSRKIAVKIKNEIKQNLFTGYYQTPTSGTAGPAKHAIHGLFAVLITKYDENRMLPFFVGSGTYDHFDADGNPNMNHLFFKIQEMIEKMPQSQRDASTWNIYLSKEDVRRLKIFEEKVIYSHANFVDIRAAYTRDNFMYQAVPHWKDGAVVIAQPGMIQQGFRERGAENTLYFQREKRDTVVFMDGAHLIEPLFTGYKFGSRAALEAANGTKQYIFTNLEFGALSPADLAAGATTANAATHFAFQTSANAGATVFTTFSNATEGQRLYLRGGSDTNPTTIAAANTNFVGLPDAGITFKAGVQAEFLVVGGKFVLIGLSEVSGAGIIEFTVDDQTPSVAGGSAFVVNTNNDAAKVDITSLDNGSVGTIYTIYGATGTNTCVLKAGGNLALTADITMSTGVIVKLMYTNQAKFVKVN